MIIILLKSGKVAFHMIGAAPQHEPNRNDTEDTEIHDENGSNKRRKIEYNNNANNNHNKHT